MSRGLFKIIWLCHGKRGLMHFFFFQPFPKQQIFDSSKLKEFADNNFKFDENGRKFMKQVENTVGKGEIVCYE